MSETTGVRRVRDVPERWPVASSAELASGSIVTLRTDMVRMPDGEPAAGRSSSIPARWRIVALDEAGQVLLIRQYRHPVGRLLWELPAGLRDVAGEPPLATAQRELLEEAGYRAADWHVLVDFFSSPGISTERLRILPGPRAEPGPRAPSATTCASTRRRSSCRPGCRSTRWSRCCSPASCTTA